MQLPFLFVYGPIISKVALVALVVVTTLGLRRFLAWLARNHTKSEIAWLESLRASLRPGLIVVRGRVVEGDAATMDRSLRDIHTRSEVLVVEVDGMRVRIDGPVRVLVGAISQRSESKSVGVGDEVYVRGLVGETQHGWTLSACGGAVEITARAPSLVGRAPSRIRAGLAIAAISLAWLVSLRALGHACLDRARNDTAPRTEIAGFDALAVSAALPFTCASPLRSKM